MQSQQAADSKLLQSYTKLLGLCVLLILLGVLGLRLFSGLDRVSDQGLQLEHSRLVNLLAMIRSKWLQEGKPRQLKLEWITQGGDSHAVNGVSQVLMSDLGWPTLARVDAVHCEALWQSLMGSENGRRLAQIRIHGDVCEYSAANGDSIRYRAGYGSVKFLTNK